MGRQQQFQVLKAALRRTLLRRFHSPPPAFSSSHREREGPALLSRALSRLAEEHSNKASRPGCQSRELSLRNAPPRTGKCMPPEVLRPRNAPAEVPLPEPLHRSFAANPLPEHLRFASPWWASGSAGLLRRVLPSSSPGGSRGLASLAAGAKQTAEDEAGRDGQGGDEGGSASVSGREFPDARRRRKRKTPAEATHPPASNAPPKVSTGRRNSPVSKNDLNPSDANPPQPSDNVAGDPVRPARKKRSKEISGERIHQAFGESGDPSTPPVLGEALAHRKPLVSLGVVEAQPVEASAIGKQSEISVEPICTSQGPVQDGSGRNQPVGGDNLEDRENLRDGFAPPAPILVSPTDTRINQKETAQRAAAKIDELVQQDDGETFSSEDAVEPVDAVTSTDREKRMANGHKRNVSGAMEELELGANGDEGNSSANSSSEEQVLGTVTEADFSDPQALYKKLLESKGGRGYRNQEKSRLNSIFYRFAVSGWVSDQALSLYINSKFFPTAASRFRKFFMHKSSPELRSFLISKGATNEALQLVFPLFAEFCINEFPSEISRYRELVNTADMTKPDAWYPFARAIKRKVVYHKGPTNSGKTYNALQRFMAAPSGIYCSPLRLLAMEVFDTVNVQGVYCNLHTGQERQTLPFANHLACTVEMCYLTQQWDVAVIDEIQMMSDEYRGWAWTRAFLGLQADEIHVCGDPSALPLIRNLCAGMGDDLEEHEYERFMPLKVAEESLRGDFRNIEAGDCIVAFSRRDIFDIKREVELASKHRCCVIYGALPPETRTQQAKLFNETSNGYSVLVASDAVGMGLNLNIRRVVFFSLDKFDGDSKKPVPPAQVKQIAGRAGRRNSLYPEGVTTTFFSQDLDYLRSSMAQDFEPATAAGLFPVFEQVELFASQLPNETFAKLLERFSETCKLDGAYFLSRYDNLKRVANMLEKVKGLSLEDRFNFCFAPVNVRDPESMAALFRYASAFSQKIPVCVEMGVPSTSAKDEFELLDLEARHQVLSMYLWLSQHFPGDLFPQREKAGDMASKIAVLLGQSLVQSSRRWSKRKLSNHPYRGRQFGNTGRTDNRQHVGAPAEEENFVPA